MNSLFAFYDFIQGFSIIMGKFSKIKKAQLEETAEQKMEWEAAGAKDSSSDDDSDDSDTEKQPQENTEETRKRAELWTNRERVLVLCSRGADVRTRYLMKDLKDLLPHAKGDSKLDQQKSLNVLNEIAEMKNCTKVMYFESRKRKDTYLWMSNVENGPSIKFLVHNVHTMKELKMSGNCLKASRPILSFDDAFEKKPQLKLIKTLLIQVTLKKKFPNYQIASDPRNPSPPSSQPAFRRSCLQFLRRRGRQNLVPQLPNRR